ncbi:MAG: hypothetical protein LBG93_05060 [Treponema sp.]|jgi:hypothetical protein|nr:hypothetical protein [Treponema sp.]
MDSGQIVYISLRLALGGVACFLAIMLWSRTRDVAWMLMVIGVIASYVETVYATLGVLGISSTGVLDVGTVPLMSIVLPNMSMVFFISAFVVMVFRKYRVGV